MGTCRVATRDARAQSTTVSRVQSTPGGLGQTMSTPAIRLSGQALWCTTSKELTLNVMHSITIIYINSISWKIDQNPQDFDKGRGFTPKYPCPLLGKNTGGYLDRQKQAQNVGIGILNHFWHNRTQETICGWTWATLSTHIQYMHCVMIDLWH